MKIVLAKPDKIGVLFPIIEIPMDKAGLSNQTGFFYAL